MRIWVYIYKDIKDDFVVGLSPIIDNSKSNLLASLQVVYLRPFKIIFDAIAHKHLLDSLSTRTVSEWIDKHKKETKTWLQICSTHTTK